MTQMEIANTLRNAAELLRELGNAAELLRELAAWDEDALMIEAQADECDKAAIAIMRLESQP